MSRTREGGKPPRTRHTGPCPSHESELIEFKQYWSFTGNKYWGSPVGYCSPCYHETGNGQWRWVQSTGVAVRLDKLVSVTCEWCEQPMRKRKRTETQVCKSCRPALASTSSRIWVRTCRWERCQVLYVARRENEVSCSHDCASSYSRAKRRLERKTGGTKQPKLVQDRDLRLRIAFAHGYKCHLCGKLIDLSRQGPHPQSLAIDHLVPRADDSISDHNDPANLAPAHFSCNSKRTHLGEAQLQLIGAH